MVHVPLALEKPSVVFRFLRRFTPPTIRTFQVPSHRRRPEPVLCYVYVTHTAGVRRLSRRWDECSSTMVIPYCRRTCEDGVCSHCVGYDYVPLYGPGWTLALYTQDSGSRIARPASPHVPASSCAQTPTDAAQREGALWRDMKTSV